MSEKLKQILEALGKVTIWGTLPIVFAFLIIFVSILTKAIQKEQITPLGELCTKKKKYKVENLFSKTNYFCEIYLGVCITFAIIPFVVIFNAKFEEYIYRMLENIGELSNITMGLTSIAVTMAVVIVVFDKNYYIVFSIKEVLQNYKFVESLVCVIASCVMVCIISMTLLDEQLVSYFDIIRFVVLEIAILYNVLGVVHIFYVCIKIMFVERKNELSLLRKLYQRFWIHRFDMTYLKKKGWKREAIEINIEYLLERYINICKKKKIRMIKDIEFGTTLGCYKEKWYYKVKSKLIYIMIVLFVASSLVCILVLREDGQVFICVNLIVTIATIVLSYLNVQSFQLVLLLLLSDTWGYYICDKNNKELLIPRVALRKSNVFVKYIMRMNSLNAFFYIWINDVGEKKKDMKIQFQDILDWFEVLEQKSMITYFPMFTIGYFLYKKGIKVGRIKELYDKYVIKEGKKYLFERMMHSQILYLTINFNKGVFDYRKQLNEYLLWIQQ